MVRTCRPAWLNHLLRSWLPVRPAVRRRPAALHIETLEDRCTPASFLVTSALDASFSSAGSGSGTSGDLRYCIDQALRTPEADSIAFDAGLAGRSIRLATTTSLFSSRSTPSGDLNGVYGRSAFYIGGGADITIDGANAPGVTIDATSGFFEVPIRLFTVYGGGKLNLANVALSGGTALGGAGGNPGGGGGAGMGGAVCVDGASSTLTASNVLFQNNRAVGGAGGAGMASASGGGGGGGLGWGGSAASDTGGDGGGSNGGRGIKPGEGPFDNTVTQIIIGGGGSKVTNGNGNGLGGGGGGGGRAKVLVPSSSGQASLAGLFGTLPNNSLSSVYPVVGGQGGSAGFGGGGGGSGAGFEFAGSGGFGGGGGGSGGPRSTQTATSYSDFPGDPYHWRTVPVGAGGFGAGAGGMALTPSYIVNTYGEGFSGGGGGGGGAGLGGAIFSNGGSVTLTSVQFQNNSAQGGAGGPRAPGTSERDCLPGEAGLGLGGSVFARNGTLRVLQAASTNNSANQGADYYLAADNDQLNFASGALSSDRGASAIGGGTNAQTGLLRLSGTVNRTSLAATTLQLVSPTLHTYTGSPMPAAVVVVSGNTRAASLDGVQPAVTYVRVNSDGSTTDLGNAAPTVPGSYRFLASFAGTNSYGLSRLSTTFTIVPVTPTITLSAVGGGWTGAAFSASASIAGVNGTPGSSLEGVPLVLDYVRLEPAGGTTGLGATAPSAAGSFQVTASFAGSAGYVGVQKTASFTIAAPAPKLTLSAPGGFYTGHPLAATATVAGANGQAGTTLEGVGLSLGYVRLNSDGSTTDLGLSAPFAEGNYRVTATFPGSATYQSASATANFAIQHASTSLLVTTTVDEDNGTSDPTIGAGASLREAVHFANLQGTFVSINFAPSLIGQTLPLTMGEITVANSYTIDGGPGVTITGNGAGRIFHVTANAATFKNLTITGGNAAPSGKGGAIYNEAPFLTVTNCTITGNAAGWGGGIASDAGTVFVQGGVIRSNSAIHAGGGVYNGPGGTLHISLSKVTDNQVTGASSIGGGLANAGTALVFNTRIDANHATGAGSSGGGMANVSPATATLISSLIVNNTAATAPDVHGTVASSGHDNTIGNASGSSGWGASDHLNVGNLSLVGLTPAIQIYPKVKVADGAPLVQDNLAIGDPYTQARLGQPGDSIVSIKYYAGTLTAAEAAAGTPLPGAPSAAGNYTVLVTYTSNSADYVSTSAAASFYIAPPLVVNSTADDHVINAADGHLSLRAAIDIVNQVFDITKQIPITFAPSLAGQTIHLSSPLAIIAGASIVGPGADRLTLTADYHSGIFDVQSAWQPVSISGLTLTGAAGDAAIVAGRGSLDVTNCVFTGNGTQGSPSLYAGGLVVKEASVTIAGCTFADNTALRAGSIYIDNADNPFNPKTVTIANSTIVNTNPAVDPADGLIEVNQGVVKVINSTVSGGGTGIALSPYFGATLSIGNSIVAGNGTDVAGSVASLGHNLIGQADPAAGWVSSDQLGDPVTPLDPQLDATFAPLPGSPAIDAGDDSLAVDAAGSPYLLDQRGLSRVWNGTVDIGAVEFGSQPLYTTTTVAAGNAVYDGTPHGVTGASVVTADGGILASFGNPALSYTYYAGTLTAEQVSATTPLAGAPTGAGAYTVVAHFTSSVAGYASTDSAPAHFVISPRAITVTADTQAKGTGFADPTLTYKITGGSLLAGDTLSGAPVRDPGETVASYSIRQGTLSASANYALSFVNSILLVTAIPTPLTGSQSVEVSSASGSATAVSGSLVGGPRVAAAGAGFDGTVTVGRYGYSPGGNFGGAGDFFDVNVSSSNFAEASSVQLVFQNLSPGTPILWYPPNNVWRLLFDANRNLVLADQSGNVSFTVTTTTSPSLSDLTGTYFLAGTVAPTFDVPDQQGTFGDASVTVTGTLASGQDAPAGSQVTASLGTQTVQATVGTDGTFTAMFDTSALPAGNYTIDYAFDGDGAFEATTGQSGLAIAGVRPTFSINGANTIYDSNAHGVTATVAGVDGTAADGLEGVGLKVTYYDANGTLGEAPIHAGTYIAVASFDGSTDYLPAQSNPFAFTISPLAIEVTIDAGQGKTYGADDPSGAFHLTGGTMLSGDGFGGWLARDPGEDVGDYAISQGTLSAGPSYTITFVGSTFHISPADLYVTAAANSKTYGQTASDTGSVIGVQFSDGITASFASAGDAADAPAGNYGITTTLSDPNGKLGNYAVHQADATLTVNQATASIAVTPYGVTYNGGTYSASGSATGVLNEDLSAGLDLSGTTHTQAGTHADTWTFHDPNGNYADASGTVNDSIGQATASISVVPYSITYDGGAHTAGGSATGALNEDLSVGLDLSGTTRTQAGSYSGDAWTFHDPAGNYQDASGTVNNSIAKAHLSVTADSKARAFGIANPTLTATLSGFVGGDGSSVVSGTPTLNTTASTSSPVGVYPITVVDAGSLAAANYDFPSNGFVNSTLTITLPTRAAYILSATASGAVTAAGNATVNLPGGLYVDSNSTSAILASGNAQVNVGGIVQIVGGISKSGNAAVTKTGTPAATSDPLAGLPLPAISGLNNYGAANVAGNTNRTLSPGIYTSIKVSGNARVTLAAGTYIIAGGGLSVSGNGSLTGTGVLIFNAGSSYNGTTDGGSFGSISLGGNGTIDLSAPSSGPFAGVVIFQSRGNSRPLVLSGNGAAGLTGTVYAPAASAGLGGNAQLTGPIVVATLSVTGNAGAFQLAGGASSGYASSTSNWITNGILTTAVQDDTGASLDAGKLARLDDAMAYLNDALGAMGVHLSWAEPGTSADVHIHFASATPQGGAADGVLGFTTAANDVYFASGWNMYTGLDPSGIAAGQFDFLTLATHELAHTVGLGESIDPSSVMYEYLTSGTVRRTFTEANLSLINTNADRFMKLGGDLRHAPGQTASPLSAPTAVMPGGTATFGVVGSWVLLDTMRSGQDFLFSDIGNRERNRTDNSYLQRVGNLSKLNAGGLNPNGSYAAAFSPADGIVPDDAAGNQLDGGPKDCFFANEVVTRIQRGKP